jgi:hypothetical protein
MERDLLERTRGRVGSRIGGPCAGREYRGLASSAEEFAGRRRPAARRQARGRVTANSGGYVSSSGDAPMCSLRLRTLLLPPRFRHACDYSGATFLLAQSAPDESAEVLSAPLLIDYPRAGLERGTITDMARVAAGKFRDPVSFLVAVVTDDRSLHET